MTRQRDFKSLVRERMEKTGERYTTARAQLLGKLNAPLAAADHPGLLPGYDRFGGICGDTAVLTNVLRQAGIKNPLTNQPFDETTVNGLCGGPGLLYAVFEYKGHPPMLTMVLRSRSMPDVYIGEGLKRLGVKFTEKQSSTPKAARKTLDEALAAKKAALCTVDIASLPWYGLPKEFVGMGPHVVGVAGRDGDDVWLDDRSPRPMRVALATLDDARARYRAAKSRLITIDGADAKYDHKSALRAAIADTAKSYHEYAVPKAFQSNCGLAGLEKFCRMLTDPKDKKGWPTVFEEGARAYAGLYRLYDCTQFEYTAPAGGRAWYAEFLDAASGALAAPALKQAAEAYRRSGECFAEIAAIIAECGDPAIKLSCELADRRAELRDNLDDPATDEFRQLWLRRSKLGSECKLTKDAAGALFGKIAAVAERLLESERAAAVSLRDC